ncbi:MAG: carbamate kinase [Elusimicrobia bacterium]|nr:carbamate kinase [Elusimicrobiota bacterium]
MEHELFVVALGGNALLDPKEKGTTEEQMRSAERTCELLAPLLKPEFHLVITHGNGPQVGNINLQQELASSEVPPLSLDTCVAMSEGSMGHFLQMGMLNVLRRHQYRRYVVTTITQVIVDPQDPAFQKPSKPVGSFYTADQAQKLMAERQWIMKEDSKRGWRRVVPSPKPVKVIQRHMIKTQVLFGDIVICVGGGGVPVMKLPDKTYKAVEAVIDKDLASANLASNIRADCLIILTAVPNVCVHFKTPQEKKLGHVTTKELRKYLEEGHFAEGSMRPKVEAALYHLANEGRRVIITDIESLPRALEGKAGTHIQRYQED